MPPVHVHCMSFTIGQRVELHPACDLWMRGARFGTVHSVAKDGTLRIKMDHPQVRRLVLVPPDLALPKL